MILIVILTLIVLAVFAVGFLLLLAEATGSWSGAAFIVGGVYLVALIILCLVLRKRSKDAYMQAASWKPLALMALRYVRSLLGN